MFFKIIFNSPWYYAIVCVIFSLTLTLFLYFKQKKNADIPKSALRLMSFLRFFSVSIISFLLLNIFIKRSVNETQTPSIILAIDNSASMTSGKDSTSIKELFTNKINDLKQSIGSEYNIKTVLFGAKIKSGDDSPEFNEKETDINNLLSEVENNYSNENIGAMILISDGIYNKGANPIFSSEKLGYPIYTIAIGDTNEIKDVAITKINHNQFSYLGNVFPVEAMIDVRKFAGKEIIVSLNHNGNKKSEQKFKISSDRFLTACTFTVNADERGVQKYNININVLEGESNTANNSQSFLIEVIDNRSKILFIAESPHPDVAAISEVITNNSSYELKFTLFSELKESIKPYSLIIIHGFNINHQKIIDDCRSNNIPYWIMNPMSADNLNGVKITGSNNRWNDTEPVLNNSFGLFNLSEDLQKFIKDLPAIKTFFGNYSVSNGVNTLINQRIGSVDTDNPVFIFNESSGLKSSVFIGDGLWRWKMRDFSEHKNNLLFSELISKTIQYLSVKSDKSFFRINSPKIINENEIAEIGAEVYNKSYELINEPDVSLTLVNSENKQFNYIFSKLSSVYKLNLGYLPHGEYRYEAKVKLNNEILVKKGSFAVKEIVAEKINTVANHQLLNQIATRSGAKSFQLNEFEKLSAEILKNPLIKPITYTSNATSSIIELKWLLFVLLAIFTMEWFFRKRYISI